MTLGYFSSCPFGHRSGGISATVPSGLRLKRPTEARRDRLVHKGQLCAAKCGPLQKPQTLRGRRNEVQTRYSYRDRDADRWCRGTGGHRVRGRLADTGGDRLTPSLYQLLSVAFLESQGPYQMPRRLDTAGNNNGFICAHALADAATLALCGPACPVPVLYDFLEDDITHR
jgi:hypothetical protein